MTATAAINQREMDTAIRTTNPAVRIGERYDRAAGLAFLTRAPLGEIMRLAHAARQVRMPGNIVSYVCDTNPNYTNVCVTDCTFCAFYRRPGHAETYTLTPEELAAAVKRAEERGATTVLFQGGHNPQIRLPDWLAYIAAVKAACPTIHVHPFSPAEYVFMAKLEKKTVREILQAVYAAGVDTLPGGGAEILTESVRAKIAKKKASSQEWLDTCETAHEVGFRTTATMMFGHLETAEDIIDHLLALREVQDRTGGFSSFIPWSFKPGDVPLSAEVMGNVHPAKYVRIIATARLLLDNFQHVQSSWFSESVPAGQLGLLAGADDFGGVLIEENVLRQAGHDRATTVEDVRTIIRRAGFSPAQRDTYYQLIGAADAAEVPA